MKTIKNTIPESQEGIRILPDLISYTARKFPDNTALASVEGTSYNYRELQLSAHSLARMLYGSGINAGDRVAILAENSPHWGIAYFGILSAGAVTVPILPDFQGPEVKAILEHAKVRLLIVSEKMIQRLPEQLPDSVEMAINLDTFSPLEVKSGKIIHTSGENGLVKPEVDPSVLAGEEKFNRAAPDDLASIIYTSGTTGRSKGVMLTHRNILSNAIDVRSIHQVVPEDVLLSVLPLAHTYECTIGMVVPLLNGASIHYISRPPTASYLGPLLQQLAPTTMLTVPLIIEKIYRTRVKPALEKSAVTRALLKVKPTRRILYGAAVRKLMKFFGGRMRFFGVGGAPLAPDVEKFLIEGGFPYAIGYGMTETSPMVAGFGPRDAVYRSVGRVMDGVTVRIDQPDPATGEGEILIKGPNVMKGYYLEEEKTREVFTEDGYLRSGDLGYINRKGILFIRGRSKNMILGPNGENIYPEEIEAVINSDASVSESMVMQVRGKLVALVHLNLDTIEERFHHLKENATEFQHQVQQKAQEILDELLIRVNSHVSRNSRLQRMIHQQEPFEKTPTQKIKRFLYH
ncbi:MAG: AMP-binding protein [Bacteroidales bacterium]